MEKYYKEVLYRINNYKNLTSIIGREIKVKRRALSRTLESLADLGTSISYLSKIENNKIIASPRVLAEICEKVYISKEEIKSMTNYYDEIQNGLECLLYEDLDEMQNIYDNIKGFNFQQSCFIKFLYYKMTEDYQKLSEEIQKIQAIVTTLTNDELVFMLLFHAYLNYHKEDYQECYENILHAKKIVLTCNFKLLKYLLDEIELYVLLELKPFECENLYQDLLISFTNIECWNKIFKFKKEYLKVRILSKKQQISEFNIVSLKKRYNDLYQLHQIIHDQKMELKHICKEDNKYIFNRFLACIKLNRLEYITAIYNELINSHLSNKELILVNYLYLKATASISEQKEFLVNHAIKWSLKAKCYLYASFYKKELININNELCRYKENTQLLLDFEEQFGKVTIL